jgi:SAM-dependent methyltransferase
MPLRVLSLASGAARIEATLLGRSRPGSVHLTLTDINPDLLAQARSRLFPHTVSTTVTDVNAIDFAGEKYDIILCVSALHHMVELEHIVSGVRNSLADGGEFWSIGEYVGRTGARLWPEAYEVANAFFQSLPERYRFNRTLKCLEAELPNSDCSVSSFEGIRSDQVEHVLAKCFNPDWLDKRSCFTWRLFDSSYAGNYDIANPDDCALVRRGSELDYELQQKGGRPVTLNGVFVPR